MNQAKDHLQRVLRLDEPGARARLIQHLAWFLADEGDPRGELALLIIAERLIESLSRYAQIAFVARAVVFDGPRLFNEDGTLNTVEPLEP
jgi:hypothetical protein